MGLRLMVVLVVLGVGLAAAASPAAPAPAQKVSLVDDWDVTSNLTALSFSERNSGTSGPESNFINSDLAFWGDMIVKGH